MVVCCHDLQDMQVAEWEFQGGPAQRSAGTGAIRINAPYAIRRQPSSACATRRLQPEQHSCVEEQQAEPRRA